MTRTLRFSALGICLIFAGCNIFFPTPTPEEAFLEGTWTVTSDTPPTTPATFEATFDSTGQLSQIKGTRTSDGGVVTFNASASTTTVNGSDITISIPVTGATATVFQGTISEDQNTITGTTTQQIDLGNFNISIPSGDLTFQRNAT